MNHPLPVVTVVSFCLSLTLIGNRVTSHADRGHLGLSLMCEAEFNRDKYLPLQSLTYSGALVRQSCEPSVQGRICELCQKMMRLIFKLLQYTHKECMSWVDMFRFSDNAGRTTHRVWYRIITP